MSAGKLAKDEIKPLPVSDEPEAVITITRSTDPREKFKVTFVGEWTVVQVNAIQPLLRIARRQHINSQKENTNE